MRRKPILFFLVLSFILHLLLSLVAFIPWKFSAKKPEAVEVLLVKEKPPYQIADIEKPAKEEKPKEAKFAGLYDSTVEKERVAESHLAPAKPDASAQSRGSALAPPNPHRPIPSSLQNTGMRLAAKPPEPEPFQKSSEEGLGEDFFNRTPGDFFPNYQKGDKTYLNVLRFPQVTYFVRLKKIFRTTFNPVPALRGSLLQIARGQVEVRLGVSINRSGNLEELFVINSSGLPSYDQEALRTIRASSPFAVPPADLLDASSHLRMVWTFTVYL